MNSETQLYIIIHLRPLARIKCIPYWFLLAHPILFSESYWHKMIIFKKSQTGYEKVHFLCPCDVTLLRRRKVLGWMLSSLPPKPEAPHTHAVQQYPWWSPAHSSLLLLMARCTQFQPVDQAPLTFPYSPTFHTSLERVTSVHFYDDLDPRAVGCNHPLLSYMEEACTLRHATCRRIRVLPPRL